MSADLGQSETSGQRFSRWFTEYPSTHVNAGKTVEVIAVETLDEEHRDGDDGAGSYPSHPGLDRPASRWRRLVGPWERIR